MDKKIVAIVDDESLILDTYEQLLRDEYQIIKFNSPHNFLNYLSDKKDTPFDGLIADYKMPQMNGIEMITTAQSKGFYFPFLLFSGFLDKDVMKNAINLGAFRLLDKPCTRTELFQSLNDVIYENEFQKIHREIRSTISRLREFYSTMAVLLNQYLPPKELNKLIIEYNSDANSDIKTMDSERLVANLEKHLEELLVQDENLEKLRRNNHKKAS